MSNDVSFTDEQLLQQPEPTMTNEQETQELTPYQKYRQDYINATKLTLVDGGIHEGKSQVPPGVLYARVEQEKAKNAILDLIQDSPVYICDEPVGDINIDFFHIQRQVASNVWSEMKRNGKTTADGTVFQWIAASASALGKTFMVPNMEIPATAVYRQGINSEEELYNYLDELFNSQCKFINVFSVGGQVREKIDIIKFADQPVVTIQNVPEEHLAGVTRIFALATKSLPTESQAKSKANVEKQKRIKK